MTKTDPKPVDLANLDPSKAANEGFEFELIHPVTKAPLGQFITIYGRDSDTYQDLQHDRFNETMRARMANGEGKIKTSQEIDAQELELLVACTKGFRNVNFSGELSFTHANAIKLYSVAWVRQQVNTAINDIGNFIKA